jgi:hypothetical protein
VLALPRPVAPAACHKRIVNNRVIAGAGFGTGRWMARYDRIERRTASLEGLQDFGVFSPRQLARSPLGRSAAGDQRLPLMNRPFAANYPKSPFDHQPACRFSVFSPSEKCEKVRIRAQEQAAGFGFGPLRPIWNHSKPPFFQKSPRVACGRGRFPLSQFWKSGKVRIGHGTMQPDPDLGCREPGALPQITALGGITLHHERTDWSKLRRHLVARSLSSGLAGVSSRSRSSRLVMPK